jgi:hypothetical protein
VPNVAFVVDRSDTDPPTGPRLELLRRLGYGEMMHDSHVPFLSHLIGVRRLLVSWGERPALCDGGLFHSAYGTEYFQPDAPASRDDVRAVIGDEAEAIAWVWCTIRRDTITVTAPHTAIDRGSGETMPLSDQMASDIATLWVADTVEQVARMDPEERAFSQGILRVLHLAGPQARAAVESVLPLLGDR